MDPNQLAQVEQLVYDIYLGYDSEKRAEATLQLNQLQSNPEFIPQCQYILDNTQQSYAQLVASTSLELLITQFWNKFLIEQKIEIKNYVLGYLAARTSNLEDFVIKSLCKLACRITKLGWFDSPEHRTIIEETNKFLEASIPHHIVGLVLLNVLVQEMNSPSTGRTLTLHRKTSVSFRDQALFQIFQIAMSTLKQLKTGTMGVLGPGEEVKISTLALNLAFECLSFDFIGTNPEETAEDVSTVQVPTSWRPLVQDTTTMQLFFDCYTHCDPPRSKMALQALVQLSSVRRSLFSSEKERNTFLQALMTGIYSIMKSEKGLDDGENYHEFCRLLGRLKASYQLSELVKTTGFTEWIELASEFTIKSFNYWEESMNSIHYLLALWGRLVAALPYLRTDGTDSQRQIQALKDCVMRVVEPYITTMICSVEKVVDSQGGIEDPLNDEGSLREQMDRLPVLARLEYESVSQFLILQFENYLNHYDAALKVLIQNHNDPNFMRQFKIFEGCMTWLTHMVGSVIGGSSPSDLRKGQADLLWDGRLSKYVFHLVSLLNSRMDSTGGQSKCDEKLEISILQFFTVFKKVFLLDNANSNSVINSGITSIPGVSNAHPMLSNILSSYASIEIGNVADNNDTPEILTIYKAMDIGEQPDIMNMIVNKLCNNIKFWNKSDTILQQTLEVFVELITTYSSSKALLALGSVNFLVHNHTGNDFPFLGYENHHMWDNKYRTIFYSALSRLVFSASEDVNNQFDAFIAPNIDIVQKLNQSQNLRVFNIRLAIIGIMRDLRGIASSTYNKRTYNLLFEVLLPDLFPLMIRITETWFDDSVVMTALFKFMQEFVFNKNQRILFDQSSANGILLFRETSTIVCAYGKRILEVPVQNDIYLEKYKGIRLMLNTLTCSLSGNYVNFGVFNLYQDGCLQEALDVALQTCLQIPIVEVLTYVKLAKAYFAFLEVLFRSHLDVLSGLDSATFITLIKSNHEGLQSSDQTICALCASTIDHLATYMFLNTNKDKPTVRQINAHVASEPALLNDLMSLLFNTLLFTPQANQWSVTRPILSLLLASEDSYNEYQRSLIASQSEINKPKLFEEFLKLTSEIQKSVEMVNRDKFTQKLTVFRLNVRAFLTL